MAKDSFNWLIYKIHDSELQKAIKKYFKGHLLDIGCGIKPYKDLTKDFVQKHTGIDHSGTMHSKKEIDVFSDAYKIPFKENLFDSVLCTCVIEHLEEPQTALNEAFRLLKPGGIAIYTAPFIWHIHEEPRDFFRYSKYGFEYLSKKSGFEVVELIALSGFWVTFAQLMCYNLARFNRSIIRISRIMNVVYFIIQRTAYLLEKIDKTEKWTWCYLVVLKKPELK